MSKPPAPSDVADKFMLRLPEGMRERIATAAKTNGRSMNSEIVSRLEGSFTSADEPVSERAALVAERIVQRVVERVELIGAKYEDRIAVLEEENRALRDRDARP